jgi:hypothetical protein
LPADPEILAQLLDVVPTGVVVVALVDPASGPARSDKNQAEAKP